MKKRYFVFSEMLLLLFVVMYGIYVFNDYVFVQRIHHLFGIDYPGTRLFAVALMNMMLTFPIPAGVTMVIKLLKNWYEKLKEAETLINENTIAELQLLKAQIHPHFLFNTLNNIYAFTLNKSSKSGEMVLQLSGMMKYMTNDCEAELVDLLKEIEILNNYIGLEKIRYGNRLDLQITIAGETANKRITPLLMIPFLENCFKHGASKMLKDPWIKLFIQVDENLLHFSLSNSKPSDGIVNGKGGIGLSNVKKRLELLYSQNHLLLIEETENTFTVNMQVPIFSNTQSNTKHFTYAEL